MCVFAVFLSFDMFSNVCPVTIQWPAHEWVWRREGKKRMRNIWGCFLHFWPLGCGFDYSWPEHRIPRQTLPSYVASWECLECPNVVQLSQRVTPIVDVKPLWILICLDILGFSAVRSSWAFRLFRLVGPFVCWNFCGLPSVRSSWAVRLLGLCRLFVC